MNPIQQAISALEESGAWAPGAGRAMDILRSLQKEVEGVELPEADFFLDGGSTPCWYESSVRTAVAAALGRQVVPQEDAVTLLGNRLAREHAVYLTRASTADLVRTVLAATPSPEATQPTQADPICPKCKWPLNAHDTGEPCQPTQAEAPSYTHKDVAMAHAEGYKLGLAQEDRATQPPASQGEREALAKFMADKLMTWALPQNFSPDCFITFDRERAEKYGSWPTGTNLLSHEQAVSMLLAVMPATIAIQIKEQE